MVTHLLWTTSKDSTKEHVRPDSRSQVEAVSLKLPTFWTLQPKVWFHQAESQFVSRQITSSTKYHYVVAALDQDTAQRILDLLDSPPAADPYTAIKERLLRAYTVRI